MNMEQNAERLAAFDKVIAQHDESTRLSWLWAFIFGPIYFAVYGFWGRAFILLILNMMIIGFFIAPFMVYPAWKKRARKRAIETISVASAMQVGK